MRLALALAPRAKQQHGLDPALPFWPQRQGSFQGSLLGGGSRVGWGGSWVLRTSRPERFGVRTAKFRESTAGEEPRYLLCLVSGSKQS